jgi:two-component system NtrC family sensor kinase
VAALEYAGLVEHHHAVWSDGESLHRDLRFLVITSVAFLVTLCATISITSSIVGTLRTRERQLLDAHDELLVEARDLEQAYATLAERQRQLVQTEKQASLGQLVAGIAHEINNPIQFIYGNMGILSEAFSDVLPVIDAHAAARPDLRIARLDYPFFRSHLPVLLTDMGNGAARIAALVRDLKTFARRDEGTLDEPVDLNDAVRASLRLLHNQLRHVQVHEQLDPALPPLRGSVAQIEQVVVNTLQNAADAIVDGVRGVIRIRTAVEPDGARVRLSIEDNGTGMPPEVQERIFDPFFTTKQRTGGTGLGLAITFGIVQQHRGEIRVESAVGRGSVFHYLLPIDRKGAAA